MSRYTEEMLFDDIDIMLKSFATAETKVACIECYMDVYKRLHATENSTFSNERECNNA